MSKMMRVAQVTVAHGPIELVKRPIPEPKAGQVRIKVAACGVCHSDVIAKEGVWPTAVYPLAPGHEVAGVIDEVGAGVEDWKVGERVGVGWFGGADGTCNQCRRGQPINCSKMKICGLSFDGGYSEYICAPQDALARIPDGMDFADAAPLMCAGVTTFNGLRNAGALAGDIVAVQGVGGLGHLGIQFAHKMGYKVVAVSSGPHNEDLAKQLGADAYIDSKAKDPAAELQKMGGAAVILATAPSAKAMSAVLGGLAPYGTLLVIGAANEPLEVSTTFLLMNNRRVQGWASGVASDSEDTMRFAQMFGVRPMIEKFPIEKAAEAFERMISGKARYRVVLTYQ